jgi:F-type H+-transporting ATPase subunit b
MGMRAWGRHTGIISVAVLAHGAMALAAAESEASSGAIQFDFWHAIFTIAVFVGLLIVLTLFAFKPILQGLQKREDFIRGSLEQARREREQAEQRRQEYEQKIADAWEQARTIVHGAQEQAAAVRLKIEEESHDQAAELIERARREIDQARDAAVQRMYDEAIELASRLAQSALKRQMTPEEHQRLVLDSLRELGQQPGRGA